jgi:phospholipid transport system substrate-binding protein
MRSRRGVLLRFLGLSLMLVVLVSPAAAGSPTAELRGHIDQVIRVLDDRELKKESRAADRRAAIRQIAGQTFDFEETARRALGPHWQTRTSEERKEFVQLFAELLEAAYVSKIEQYHGEEIAYVGETVDGDHATVRTRLTTKAGDVPVDYRLLARGEHWRAYDVLIEGVSLVANYRSQFNKIIQTSSYRELVEKLKTKSIAPATAGKPSSKQGT